MNYTKEQQDAINFRDRSLLVSAAAGSGKTATLTRRIIESILDKEKPEDISRMLIVTFTMNQYATIINIVNQNDRNAFVTIHPAHEISGEGFTR